MPITVDALHPIVTQAGLHLLSGPILEAAASILDDITRWSAVKARSHLRDQHWWQPASSSDIETQLRERARMVGEDCPVQPEATRLLRDALDDLITIISEEPGDGQESLAAEVMDLPSLGVQPPAKLAAFSAAFVLAMAAQVEIAELSVSE